MAVTHMKSGTFAPIFYFENKHGGIIMMPTDELTRRYRKIIEDKLGYEFKFAETIQQAEQLQRKLQADLAREQNVALEKDEAITSGGRKALHDRMDARRKAPGTPPAEREFLDHYMESRRNKHEIFRKKMLDQVGVLNALEYDNPSEHIADLHDKA